MTQQSGVTGTAIRVSSADFFTGFLAGLAVSDVKTFRADTVRFDQAVVQAYREMFEPSAAAQGWRLSFHLSCHELHGDSPGVRQGLSAATQRGLLTWDSPFFTTGRMRIIPATAKDYLASVPGEPAVYISTADYFLNLYPGVS